MLKIDKILDRINTKFNKRIAIIIALIAGISFLYPYVKKTINQAVYILKLPREFREIQTNVEYLMGMTNILLDVIRANMDKIDSNIYVLTDDKQNNIIKVQVRKSRSGNIYVFTPGRQKNVFAAPLDKDIGERYFLSDTCEKMYVINKNKLINIYKQNN